MSNKSYLIALNRMPFLGPRSIHKLLRRWPQLEELFSLSHSALEAAGLPPKLVHAISVFHHETLEKDWRWQEGGLRHLLSIEDPDYPCLLKEIPDAPPVLYLQGSLECLQQKTVAIVGTRKPSISGMETAQRFAYEIAMHQVTVVSGLALGIDAKAHLGCLDAFGKTVAVMATGMDRIYPYRHRDLAERIAEQGLLMTEFPLGSPPIAGHFPRRNRIISGLSLCTLVVEAALKSGSLITARFACEQNRDVMAIPGSIYNTQARGCHYLLQQGAKLVMTSQDVLEELGIATVLVHKKQQAPLVNEQQNLAYWIGFEVTSVDQLVQRTCMSVEQVLSDLVALELQGIVASVPGGYVRCINDER